MLACTERYLLHAVKRGNVSFVIEYTHILMCLTPGSVIQAFWYPGFQVLM
jgi:hypothetical protein